MPATQTPLNAAPRRGVWSIMCLVIGCYVIEASAFVPTVELFGLWPASLASVYQLFSYAVLHVSFQHMAFNLFLFWIVGRGLEAELGTRGLWLLFWSAAVVSGAAHLVVTALGWIHVGPALGASGAITALVGAFSVLFPRAGIEWLESAPWARTWFAIAPTAIAGLVYATNGVDDHVAHYIHVAGLLYGAGAAVVYRLAFPRPRRLSCSKEKKIGSP